MIIDKLNKNPFQQGKIAIGVTADMLSDSDNYQMHYMDYEMLRLHTTILGTTGTGKTVLLTSIINQAIMNGWPVLVCDMKFDPSMFNSAYATAYHCGRAGDFRFLNPFGVETSSGILGALGANSYNPLMSIDTPIPLTAALLKAADAGSKKGTVAYYEDVKEDLVSTLVRAFIGTGQKFAINDFWIALEKVEAMKRLHDLTADIEAKVVLQDWLEKLMSGNKMAEEKWQQEAKGTKMFFRRLGTGALGQMLCTYSPDVNLRHAHSSNQITWAVLPSLLMDSTAKSLGRLLLSDLRSLAGYIQATTTQRKPFLVVIDEFENFVFEGISDLFDKGRSVGIAMCVAHQSLRQIDMEHSRELRDVLTANTRTKIILACEDPDQSKYFAQVLGEDSNALSFNAGNVSVRDNNSFTVSPTDMLRMNDFEIYVRQKGKLYNGNLIALPSDFELGVDVPRPHFEPNISRQNGIRLFEEFADA